MMLAGLMRALVLLVLIPLVLWILYRRPDLANTANLVVFGLIILQFFCAVGGRSILRLFRGDAYTYGGVMQGINVFMSVNAMVYGFAWFWFWKPIGAFESAAQLPSLTIGLLLAGLLVTIAIPLLTSSNVARLPVKSDRRTFETPGDGS